MIDNYRVTEKNKKDISLFWVLIMGQIFFLSLIFCFVMVILILILHNNIYALSGEDLKKRNMILQLTLMEAFPSVRTSAAPVIPLPHPVAPPPGEEELPDSWREYSDPFQFDNQQSYLGRFQVLEAMEARIKIACDLTDTRFTVFSPMGEIRFDSQDPRARERDRTVYPEILEALERGSGIAVRFDDLTGVKTIYQTLPLYVEDELIGITRVSQPFNLVRELWQKIFNIAQMSNVFALIVVSFLIVIAIRKLTDAIGKVEKCLFEISLGHYDFPLPSLRIREFASLISAIGEMARKLKQQNVELEALTMIDELTGLGNRRMFNQKLEYGWWICVREKHPISLLILDIDKFKQYNDTLGHPAGDGCLQQISDILKGTVNRHTDILVRLGGEEFGVLLPEEDEGNAFRLGEKIIQAMNDAQIPHPDSPVAPHVTISIGAATLNPNPSDSMEELFEQADKALYRAKEGGRNRIAK